jgi:hypothetical protein
VIWLCLKRRTVIFRYICSTQPYGGCCGFSDWFTCTQATSNDPKTASPSRRVRYSEPCPCEISPAEHKLIVPRPRSRLTTSSPIQKARTTMKRYFAQAGEITRRLSEEKYRPIVTMNLSKVKMMLAIPTMVCYPSSKGPCCRLSVTNIFRNG